MKLEDYKKLPDRMPTGLLASMFQDALDNFKQEKIQKNEFLDIVNELMDKQVMSYELLEDKIRYNLDTILSDLWNIDSYDDVDIILSIVVNLGLEKCYETIKNSIENKENIDETILKEILETIEETGDNISNPYHSLEEFK